ncbi:hypothetical protein EJ04DRAFT_224429 [Polyplosphaeria fusca]|uniref:Uncharacterized protein n=1 Tax=Polyplosphaeria fusca TaxID=682080 RepID=A0A9P4R1A9_9PLEO|nr:hypothetical protein EJ04DRAFT_224429 [Polyplosphaeria fusca]
MGAANPARPSCLKWRRDKQMAKLSGLVRTLEHVSRVCTRRWRRSCLAKLSRRHHIMFRSHRAGYRETADGVPRAAKVAEAMVETLWASVGGESCPHPGVEGRMRNQSPDTTPDVGAYSLEAVRLQAGGVQYWEQWRFKEGCESVDCGRSIAGRLIHRIKVP